jgi:hypothetical protein
VRGTRKPRTIPHLTWGPDKRATDLNNALYVLEEFVSSKRLATLAIVPTPAELIAAVDMYLTCENNPELIAHAQALRSAAETWAPGAEVPNGVYTAARAIFSVLGPEPDRDWDADDGYPIPVEPANVTSSLDRPLSELSEAAAQGSPKAAQAAQTTMHAMNLAALLASPRVLRKAPSLPSQPHLLECLDALIRLFSSDALSNASTGAEAVHDAARRLRQVCAEWTPSPEAPPEVRQAARALLTSFAVSEPPEGWDAFDGDQTH